MRFTLDREMAHAAAMDTGNRAMRHGGRTAWSEDDYNACVAEFNRLWPEGMDCCGRPHAAPSARIVLELRRGRWYVWRYQGSDPAPGFELTAWTDRTPVLEVVTAVRLAHPGVPVELDRGAGVEVQA